MWEQADSALKVMMEFAGSEAADSLDEFEGHYCQMLIAELLFKNDYGQSNRKDLLKAVHYFDSIVGMDGADAYGKADTHGVAVQGRDAFLAARAHYIDGVGYYERDSLIEACGEYLNALRMMEGHFEEKVLVGHKARFMALTYNRLGELFSEQYMTEPAIACYKKSLVFCQIEPTSANGISNLLSHIASEYQIQKQYDSCEYYNKEALRLMVDTNNLIYRDLISSLAIYNYYFGKGVEPAVRDLKRMASQTMDEDERMTRFFTIGSIYYETSQFDSALVYLVPVFENKDNVVLKRDAARSLRDIYQIKGDSLKATQYAIYQAENPILEEESNWLVSQLNELFQQHLQWEQEKAEAERRQTEQLAARRRLVRGVVTAVVVLLVLGVGLWWWMAKRRKEHEAETQTLNEEKQQLQTQVDDALQQLQTVDEALQQLQTQADDALQQARAMLPQRVADLYRAKVPNRLERIMDEFEAAYPGAMERVAAAYPELSETERQIAVLNFLHFRAKEEADLLGLSDNTVNKYRSNLRKKTENASFSSFLD
jgi:DNA-binding CsgD family transcriptional regulator